jgi:hypothetical protein
MDMDVSHRYQAAAMVVAVAVWCFLWFRHRRQTAHSITYGPMVERDIQRMNNLQFIFLSDDTHCVNLLRMRRAPFFHCVTSLGIGACCMKVFTAPSRSKWQCLYMLWGTIKGLGL